MSLGVYALGAADATERRLIEAHLLECADCRSEMADLAPLSGLLSQVPQQLLSEGGRVDARAVRRDPASRRLASRRVTARPARHTRSWRAPVATAAALATLAAGLAGGRWLSPHSGGAAASGATYSAIDPVTHVQASAALTGTSWGTSIAVAVDGLSRGQLCWLVVRSRTGASEVDGYWQAADARPVSVPASAAWQPSDIASVQVVTNTGVAVTVPISSPHGSAAGTIEHSAEGTP